MLGAISASEAISRFIKRGFALVLLMFLIGCSSYERLVKVSSNSESATIDPYNTSTFRQPIDLFSPLALQKKISQQKLQQKANNFFVLIDTSSEMQEAYRDMTRYEYGLEILNRFHQTLPDLNLSGGIYKTDSLKGSKLLSSLFSADNKLDEERKPSLFGEYRPMQIQHQLADSAYLNQVGEGSLHTAISELSTIVTGNNQPSVLLLITRWERIDEKARIEVARLREKVRFEHNQQLCVFTIGVGNSYSRAGFDQVDSCGFSVSADKIAQPRDMSHFVERIFFYGPADSDNDGIYDYLDKCLDTQKGRLVGFDGCNRFGAALLIDNMLNIALAKVRLIQ